ncbi:histidine kinase [Caloramator sp. mosi_1]|uniref:sensor histidine kinase n=1 Tax=Caloramator sp. mosi_1 TaxID=3023090 RepID=UPI00235EC2DF|nr:histidine kinase [Caloramator sp. mosi_1]WDC85137.1 histidine kinase [Caloramator sp. mosi_1]
MLAEIEGKFEISDALTSLGDMMRYNMKWTSEYVVLKEEIEHIKNYIALMNIRFDNKINLNINIDDTVLEQEILKMSLQPIVENSVKYGIKEEEQLTIDISAFVDLNNIVIIIKDFGKGIEENKLYEINYKINLDDETFNKIYMGNDKIFNKRRNNGLGLRNVNQRIKLYYGKEYGIYIESKQNFYTSVTVKLPLLILSGGLNGYEKNINS